MKVEMKQYEIERVKEIISKILEFWMYDSISMKSSTSTHQLSMTKEVFIENLERELKSF